MHAYMHDSGHAAVFMPLPWGFWVLCCTRLLTIWEADWETVWRPEEQAVLPFQFSFSVFLLNSQSVFPKLVAVLPTNLQEMQVTERPLFVLRREGNCIQW